MTKNNNVMPASKEEIEIRNEELIDTILEGKSLGDNYEIQQRLVYYFNNGTFFIPIMPSQALALSEGVDLEKIELTLEFMRCFTEEDDYLPLCTDIESLKSFVDGEPHNTLCLPASDIIDLLRGLDDFAGVALSSTRFPGDLMIPKSEVYKIESRRDETPPQPDTKTPELIH